MKIANSLIDFCSFNLGNSTSKDTADKLVQFSIATVANLLFLAILSVVSFIKADMVTGGILSSSFILLSLFLTIAFSKNQTKTYAPSAVVILGIAFLATLILGQSGHLVLWAILLFPVLAITAFEYSRGNFVAVIYGVILALVLFLPIDANKARLIETPIKVLFLTLYPIILFAISLLYFYKVKRIQETEKLLLEQKNESKQREEYLAKLSHQIRTPLNNVMIISNILSSASLDEKYKDMIDTIQASTNNLVNVLNSMVEISSGDLQSQADFNISFNLSNIINNTIRLFATQ